MCSDEFGVRIVRDLPGLPLLLFRAWTTPCIMKRWFHLGPAWVTAEVVVDLRVGGSYRVDMRDATSKIYSYSGHYQEVREPGTLAFTWPPYGDRRAETLVVLRFRHSFAKGASSLELTHLGLLHEQMRDDHQAVWNLCLDRFQETVHALLRTGICPT